MNLTNIPTSLLTDPNFLKHTQTGTQQTTGQAEETGSNTNKIKSTDEKSRPDEVTPDEAADTTQQQMIKNIKELQQKLRALEADNSLTKADQQTQISELQQELDEELVAIQLSVKKNVSTLMGSLFSSAGNTNSGLLFKYNA
ncbi:MULTISPECIES: hypothetical protein [Pseudoalteromonas]|uniref:Orphan protein n=1 Tax=Pseudoalteromonas haloplanktis TaxID=228 RepID=A0ABU1BI77_PSEHA|nr:MULTISPECIES: hypothetical protein [Pseudoalteromonas]MCF6146074.1 hypothetical protein [Pseudoalteromonas mariniglutinosa NCIMB 1770]MDQ9094188.1 hypothetical protein [Pseudoalteromonas haloplanktis]TMN68616.1 hypothetical protein CWB85_18420 [Pseudoalteromonas sp. S1727]BDF95481.1 hypothetical protein KAN5_23190 [Pseudoalteromonas sp. KAN5]